MILLAPKFHQDVSYQSLNTVTKSFTFPIARCVESIEDFGVSNGPMFFITLDSRQKYHHILVRFQDRKKLAFFTPDRKNKTFCVMTFGPKNAPAFYTAMMKNSRKSGMQISIAQL